MVIALVSKPGLTSASALSIPKDWDAAWFRGFINNLLKGGDIRNAVGVNGISVNGSIATPYATIGFGAPLTLPGQVTITPPTTAIATLVVNQNQAASTAIFNQNLAGVAMQLEFDLSGVPKAFIGVAGGAGSLIPGSVLGDLCLRTQGGSILFSQDAGVTGVKLYQVGTFTGTITGCTTSPTGTCRYVVSGNSVTLFLSTITGTSNTTSLTMTGLPAAIQPATAQNILCTVEDNTSNIVGMAQVNAGSGTITFFRDVLATGTLSTTAFTAAGTKGFSSPTITYLLT